MRIQPRLLRVPTDPSPDRCLHCLRRPGLLCPLRSREVPESIRQRRALRKPGFGDDAELSAADEHAVRAGGGGDPPGEMESGFDEQKLAVGVAGAGGDGGEFLGDLEEEEDDEPLVVEVVAEAGGAAEMRDRRRGGKGRGRARAIWGMRRDGEAEGLVLPDVGGGELGDVGGDFEVESFEGGRRRGKIGENGVDDGVFWDSAGGGGGRRSILFPWSRGFHGRKLGFWRVRESS